MPLKQGDCICLSCGYREPPKSNQCPIVCPKCGEIMNRRKWKNENKEDNY